MRVNYHRHAHCVICGLVVGRPDRINKKQSNFSLFLNQKNLFDFYKKICYNIYVRNKKVVKTISSLYMAASSSVRTQTSQVWNSRLESSYRHQRSIITFSNFPHTNNSEVVVRWQWVVFRLPYFKNYAFGERWQIATSFWRYSSVWLERQPVTLEVAGSSPATVAIR